MEGLSNILKADSGIEKVMGDIVRVLFICLGTLWLPELKMELSSFRRSLNEPEPKSEDVERAISMLKDMGLVSIRRGVRATLTGEGEETYLITLNLTSELISALNSDERIVKYRRIWRDVLERFK